MVIGGNRIPVVQIHEIVEYFHGIIYMAAQLTSKKTQVASIGICEICDRDMVAGISADDHHWIPQSKGGKKGPKTTIHRICHDKIHSVWSEKELAKTYNSAAVIKVAPEMQEFLNWVKSKRPDFYMPTKMNNRRR